MRDSFSIQMSGKFYRIQFNLFQISLRGMDITSDNKRQKTVEQIIQNQNKQERSLAAEESGENI